MPIYEYKCDSCGKVEELLMKISDPDPVGCSACGGPVNKLISQSSFALKGSGWYVTDYGGRHAGTFDDTKSPDYRARCEGVGQESSSSDTRAGATTESSPAPVTAPASNSASTQAAPSTTT
jgi:putative FmdB family regulatory protein